MALLPNAIERLTSPNSEQRTWLRSSLRQTVSCWRTKIADASTGPTMLATGNNLAGKRAR
jgi:hypothetical protein